MNLNELKQLEDQLWSAADSLRANTDLKPNEYSTPVLGLIFLKFADNKYGAAEEAILKEFNELKGTRREKPLSEIAIKHCGFYLPDNARYNYLLELPESEDLATKIKEAMQAIEDHQGQEDFKDVLPKNDYQAFNRLAQSKQALKGLVRSFSNIPSDASGDVFGKIYEYFLGKFALSEGQKGGEFFTPTSVVRLMVEMIEPYNGSVYDPACGSGGMFVQSLQFVERRKELSKKLGEPSFKKLKETLKDDVAIVQSVDTLNEHWHELKPLQESFDTYVKTFPQVVTKGLVKNLNEAQKTLRASFTPFFKAISDEAKVLDKAIREKEKAHNELVKITRTEIAEAKANDNKDLLKVKDTKLKALNALTADIKEVKALLADIKADRSEAEYFFNHISWLQERFPNAVYEDVTGLCKLATPDEVKEQDYSLNAGRYVGVVIEEDGRTEEEFQEYMLDLKSELSNLTNESIELSHLINNNLTMLLGD